MARVQGLERLKANIARIKADARAAMGSAAEASAHELANAIRANAPRDTGKLAESVKVEQMTSGKGARGLVAAAGMAWTVAAGDRNAPYARWVEFGTAAQGARPSRQNRNYKRTAVMTRAYAAHAATPAQPFFWPTYRLLRRRLKARIARATTKAVFMQRSVD